MADLEVLMKKNCCAVVAVIVLICIIFFLLNGNILLIRNLVSENNHFSKEAISPDDRLSRLIYEQFDEELSYLGKKTSKYNVSYCFVLEKYNPELIARVNEIINDWLISINDKERICVSFVLTREPPGNGGFSLLNYGSDGIVEQNKIIALNIESSVYPSDLSEYLNPKEFIGVLNIKHLTIDSRIQQQADELMIDWSDYWPNLEEIIVTERP